MLVTAEMSPPNLKILIVDDQPESVRLLLAYLKDRGMGLLVAYDAQSALALSLDEKPDLILLDMHLLGMSGLETCTRLKSDPETADIPVIFLSAARQVEDKLQAFSAGAVDYITKPFSEQEVLARIYLHLGQMAQLDQLTETTFTEELGELNALQRNRQNDAMFNSAVMLLIEQMQEPPSLVDLAQHVGTNPKRLTQIFRENVGMTVFEYLRQIRLEKGRRLLSDTQLQIQIIAGEAGFANAGDFTRAFREYFGVSPREYRKQHDFF